MTRHRAKQRPTKLPLRRRLGVYIVGLGVWGTGAAWLAYHYFLKTPGAFGPETNPLEPWWLKAHGLFAFGALWLFGLIWGVHVLNGWRSTMRRWSGSMLVALLIALIATGYLLYYVGDDHWREIVSLIHWIIGLGGPAAFLWHRFIKPKPRAALG